MLSNDELMPDDF